MFAVIAEVLPVSPAGGRQSHSTPQSFRTRFGLLLAGGLASLLCLTACGARTAQGVSPPPSVEFRVFRNKPTMLSDSAQPTSDADFEIYRERLKSAMLSPYVINATLRQPNVSKLQLIERQPHPVAWVRSQLAVEFPETELMRVSLKRQSGEEAVALLNALANSFLSEFVNGEQRDRRDLLSELEKLQQQLEDVSRSQRNSIVRLEKDFRSRRPGSDEVKHRREERLEQRRLLNQELARTEIELVRQNAKAQLLDLEAAEPAEPPAPASGSKAAVDSHAAKIRALTTEIRLLELSRDGLRKTLEQPVFTEAQRDYENLEFELDELRRQMDLRDRFVDSINTDIIRLKAELGARSRIELFRSAEME